MKLSIVTISLNQAKFLERAILSVLKQGGVSVEYIVVDAGSTDGSREIIERHRDRLAHVILEPDAGPADGLNKGFARATGDVFGYINADDFYLPDGLAKAAAALERRPDAAAIFGNGVLVDAEGMILRRAHSTPFTATGFARGLCFSLQQATFYRAEEFRAAGGFNRANKTCWDSEILLDMALNGRQVQHFDQYIGAFTIHPDSITGSGRLNQQYKRDRTRMFEKAMGRPETEFDRAVCLPFYRAAARFGNLPRLVRRIKDELTPATKRKSATSSWLT
jgi:glycosyltransferase involved in cell wall biosynthesis